MRPEYKRHHCGDVQRATLHRPTFARLFILLHGQPGVPAAPLLDASRAAKGPSAAGTTLSGVQEADAELSDGRRGR